jgi:hypothetical protein
MERVPESNATCSLSGELQLFEQQSNAVVVNGNHAVGQAVRPLFRVILYS